jgi:Fe-S-cluster-containing dehydrogenase component
MLACAVTRFGQNNLKKAALKVKPRFPHPGTYQLHICRQDACDGQPCIDVCPTAAIRRDGQGIVHVAADACTRCLLCVAACPHAAIFTHPAADRVIQCDLCHGDPACVKWCPTGAIRWEPHEEG